MLIAAECGDENLLAAIRNPEIDLHCWTMSKFLNCEYDALIALKGKDGVPEIPYHVLDHVSVSKMEFQVKCSIPELIECDDSVEGMQKWISKLREIVKTLTYGIAYGLSEFGLARKFHMSKEDAGALRELFFAAYPMLRIYLDDQAEIAYERGWSTTPLGRKRWYRKPTPVTALSIRKAIEEDHPDGVTSDEAAALYREYKRKLEWQFFYEVSSIKRRGANHPIQGSSADMTKKALVIFDRLLEREGFKFADYPRLPVHDEIVGEFSAECAEEAARLLERAMEEAAMWVLPPDLGLNIKVEAKVLSSWEK